VLHEQEDLSAWRNFAICSSSVVVRAQQEANQESDERVVTATNLVTINVTVGDGNGKYVKGLGRDQFEVYDEKVKQRIAYFSTDADPISLGIVCEIHNTTPEKARAILVALRQFTRSLHHDDDFCFMAFETQGGVATDFVPAADQLIDHLGTVKPAGRSST
jgi:VWFA-related protein